MANRASSSIQPSGFWLAQVVSIDTEKHISVKIPKLGGESVYEEVRFTGLTPDVGDYVWVSFIEGTPGSIIAFVGENDTSGPPSEADITEVIAGLGLSGGGDSGSVTIDFEPSELTTVDLTYDDKVVISDDSDSGEPKLVPMSDIVTVVHGDGGGEPIGHANKADSVISFDYSTRVFTIAPVGDSYEVWCKGKKYVKTSSETVTIGSTSDLYYISFDADGVLQAKTSFFVWDSETPTAYIYYNSGAPSKYMLFDERHGIVLDWQTHEYLHRTRGAAFASGFEASNFDVSTQNGNTDTQAQIDISGGTFFDEDLQVDIVHSNTPTANTWEQDLQGPAQIPVFYHSGTTGWTYDDATDFPLKYGATPRPTYNLNTSGTWTTPELPDSNRYGISWIVATNQLNRPVIAIMGQDYYDNVGEAEAVSWDSMNLDDLPIVELRVLYKIIYRGSGSNTPGCYFEQVDDYRNALSSATSTAAAVVDHGNLTGLGDDDHTQYLLANGTRTATELTVSGDLTVDTDTLHVDSANNYVGIGTTSPNAELDIRGASNPEIRLQSTDSTDPFLYFGDQVDAVRGGIGYDTSANALQLRGYNNSTRLTIDSSGNSTFTGNVNVGGVLTLPSGPDVTAAGNGSLRLGNYGSELSMALDANEIQAFDSSGNAGALNLNILGGSVAIGSSTYNVSATVNGSRILTVADEGSGNGLDADTVDGIEASSFLRSNAADTASSAITFSGGLTLNSDLTWNSGKNIILGGECSFDLSSGDTWGTWDGAYAIKHAYGSQVEIGASGTRGLKVHGQLDTTGNIYVNKSQAWITLDSPSTGGNTTDQSAGISIGESAGGPGATGTAAIHMTYTGDGYGYIGMGSLSGNGYPSNRAMRLYYTNDDVYFYGGTTTAGGANAYSFSGNSNVAGTGNAIYTPSGIYSTGTNWLYGPIITNNNYINAGSGYITTSSSVTANGNLYINNTSPTVYYQDSNNRSAMVHVNSNFYYVLRGSGNNSTTWSAYDSLWPFVIYLENNEARFGGQVTIIRMAGTGSYNTVRFNTTSGQLMQFTSLAEYKTDVVDINGVLGALNERSLLHDLRPVLFHENQETETTRGEYIPGFIAEEVHEVAPELTYYDKDGNLTTYAPEALIPHLVAEIQRLSGMVEELYQSAHPDWTPPQPRPSDRGAAEKAVFDAGAAYAAANPIVTPDPQLPTE